MQTDEVDKRRLIDLSLFHFLESSSCKLPARGKDICYVWSNYVDIGYYRLMCLACNKHYIVSSKRVIACLGTIAPEYFLKKYNTTTSVIRVLCQNNLTQGFIGSIEVRELNEPIKEETFELELP